MKALALFFLLAPANCPAAAFPLGGLRAADLPALAAPAPDLPAPSRAADAGPSAGWIKAVKKAYRAAPTGTLPPAETAELPAAALQQLQWDAAVYPSKAYKIALEGRTAFVIENDNLDALYVNIFDETGLHIAYGGFDENYDFHWLSKRR